MEKSWAAIAWDTVPSAAGAVIGAAISAYVAFKVSSASIRSSEKAQADTIKKSDAALAVSAAYKLRIYIRAIHSAAIFVSGGLSRAKAENIPKENYISMMGAFGGDLSLPEQIKTNEIMFLFKKGREKTIERLHDIEARAIELDNCIRIFSQKQIEFGKVLSERFGENSQVDGKSMIFQRPEGDVHYLEMQMRDILEAMIDMLDFDYSSVEMMKQYYAFAREDFGSFLPETGYQVYEFIDLKEYFIN